MKTIYKSIFIIGLGVVSLTASAQRSDSTLTRQVLLERDYNPTLQDASRVTTTPNIYKPVFQPKDFRLVETTPQIGLQHNQLGASEAGDIKTGVNFDKKRGYLSIGAGTHGNIEGAAGVRIVSAERDRLDLSVTHSSTSGTVDYIDGSSYFYKDVKAKYANTKAVLSYEHRFDPSVLTIGASYNNLSYNYYGNSYMPNTFDGIFPYDYNARQGVDVFSFGAGLRSSGQNQGLLKYKVNVKYNYFKNKYGLDVTGENISGGQLDADADFYGSLGADMVVGVRGAVMNQSFSDKINTYADAYHGFTNITGNPYVRFQGASWDAELGLNVNALFDVKTSVFVSPNVRFNAHINEVNTLYAEVGGGVNNNTFLDILQENRYADLTTRVAYSKTVYDAKIGFRSGVIPGLEFDIFGGYKHTKNDHLYVGAPVGIWANMGTPLYADISTGHVGGILKTKLIPMTTLTAKIVGYFYDTDYKDGSVVTTPTGSFLEKEAWGRPQFTAELTADVQPIDKVTLSLNYLYAGGRKGVYVSSLSSLLPDSKMKDINELNFRGEYQVTDWLSVNVRLNNILFQKYELQYGYPLQGFNILGGLSLKF